MRLLEVGPRDGLQNEKKILTLDQRESFISGLVDAGLTHIEVGSFVKKEAIPQLQDTAELLSRVIKLKKKNSSLNFWAFVPNERGLEDALQTKIDGIALHTATSETFVKKNINRTFAENKIALKNIFHSLKKDKRKSRIYLSTLVYCPFEGIISPKKVFAWTDFLLDLGYKEIALSDTTGHAHPNNLKPILEPLLKKYSAKNFALHFHDTRGTALLNTHYALSLGYTLFDSSLGGAGGCPYAPGASGNLATEDLIYYLQSRGKCKDISLNKLATTSKNLETWLDKKLPSKVFQSLVSQEQVMKQITNCNTTKGSKK